eukprot:COSAG06_NODE_2818_length_6234_cov_4.107253_1_plen_1276_part_10
MLLQAASAWLCKPPSFGGRGLALRTWRQRSVPLAANRHAGRLAGSLGSLGGTKVTSSVVAGSHEAASALASGGEGATGVAFASQMTIAAAAHGSSAITVLCGLIAVNGQDVCEPGFYSRDGTAVGCAPVPMAGYSVSGVGPILTLGAHYARSMDGMYEPEIVNDQSVTCNGKPVYRLRDGIADGPVLFRIHSQGRYYWGIGPDERLPNCDWPPGTITGGGLTENGYASPDLQGGSCPDSPNDSGCVGLWQKLDRDGQWSNVISVSIEGVASALVLTSSFYDTLPTDIYARTSTSLPGGIGHEGTNGLYIPIMPQSSWLNGLAHTCNDKPMFEIHGTEPPRFAIWQPNGANYWSYGTADFACTSSALPPAGQSATEGGVCPASPAGAGCKGLWAEIARSPEGNSNYWSWIPSPTLTISLKTCPSTAQWDDVHADVPSACATGICAEGFANYMSDEAICCHDFAAELSVLQDSCTACHGDSAQDCTQASCAVGYHSFANGSCCSDGLEERTGLGCTCAPGFYHGAQGCTACVTGKEQNEDKTGCTACQGNRASRSGICETCPLGKVANAEKTACEACLSGTAPSQDELACENCTQNQYSRLGIECTECIPPNIVMDGRRTCTACAAGLGPNSDRTSCIPCANGSYSTVGICIPCEAGKLPNPSRTACEPCPAGYEVRFGAYNCSQCPAGNIRVSGPACVHCGYGKIANPEHTSCETCPEGQVPSIEMNGENENGCVCMRGWYLHSAGTSNATRGSERAHLNGAPIMCHVSEYTEQSFPGQGCTRCGACVDCYGAVAPSVRADFVRIIGPNPDGMPSNRQSGSAPVSIFKCIYDSGCFADSFIGANLTGCKTCDDKRRSLPLTTACQKTYTGHFCSQCVDDYELQQVAGSELFVCVPCSSLQEVGFLGVAVVLCVLVVISQRNCILSIIEIHPAQARMGQSMIRSMWQPFRIIITYAQVAGEIGGVLNFSAPEMIKSVFKSLSNMLSVVDVVASAKCLGVDTFHYKWRLQVLFIPVMLMLGPLVLWLFKRRKDPTAASNNLTSHSFFVIFFCYPRICRYTFDVFITYRVAQAVNVLVADDRVLYEDENHQPYIFASYAIIIGFCFGVPIGAAALLFFEYRRCDDVEPALKARVSEAFQITMEEAEAAVNDIEIGNEYGFLTAAFKPKFYGSESMDMLRKLVLVGLIVMFERGSVAQIIISLSLSMLFLGLQMKNWPYKIDWDNRLRMMTEAHICLTIMVALAFKTDHDSSTPCWPGCCGRGWQLVKQHGKAWAAPDRAP